MTEVAGVAPEIEHKYLLKNRNQIVFPAGTGLYGEVPDLENNS